MVDIDNVNKKYEESKAGRDKDDHAATSIADEVTTERLFDDEMRALRRRECVLLITTFISGLVTLVLFIGLLCSVCKFYSIYEAHAHVGHDQELALSLAPFILLLSPSALFSTLFIVTLITTLRFITAYASVNGSNESSASAATGLIDALTGILERLGRAPSG